MITAQILSRSKPEIKVTKSSVLQTFDDYLFFLLRTSILDGVVTPFGEIHVQLQEFEVGRSYIYAMKPGYFRLYFHNLIMQLHS